MSSTNRGGRRSISDYYVTPVHEIVKMIFHLIDKYPPAATAFRGAVLDPAAGGDAEHSMSYPHALQLSSIEPKTLDTWDIREDSLAEHTQRDYLQHSVMLFYDVIMTNPPFVLAQEFVSKAVSEVKPSGLVIMLLRLNFFGSVKRKEFWTEKPGMPKYTFVHHKRMSFTDDSKTDSVEYMHCVWVRDGSGIQKDTKLSII